MQQMTRRERRDLDAEITSRILAALEDGKTPPWRRPWRAAGQLPTSVATGRPYRGINALLLAITSELDGYRSPYWLTYRQAQERGGHVRKGEYGTMVVFFKSCRVRDEAAEELDATKTVRVMRAYTVFNLDQTEGVKLPPRFRLAESAQPVEVLPALDEIMAGYVDGPDVRWMAQHRAYYSPTDDRITLPDRTQFATPNGYAETVLHELTHSTGHRSRLDRLDSGARFGSQAYAFEELVAELGAALLAAYAGIELDYDQAAAYVGSWTQVFGEHKSMVTSAALHAQRAVDRILGTTLETEESDQTFTEAA